jgi:hypothetical protein
MLRRKRAGRSSMQKFREERRANLRSQWKGVLLFSSVAVGCGIWLVRGHGWGRVFGGFILGVVLTGLCSAGCSASTLVRCDGPGARGASSGRRRNSRSSIRLPGACTTISQTTGELGSRRGRPTGRVRDRHEELQRTGTRRRDGPSIRPDTGRRQGITAFCRSDERDDRAARRTLSLGSRRGRGMGRTRRRQFGAGQGAYVSASRLTEELEKRPPRLGDAQRQQVSAALASFQAAAR